MKPEIKESLDLYGREGCPTGSFLQACLENKLVEAFARADEGNRLDMFEIAGYLYNELPDPCWGSPEKVKAWLKVKREEREEREKRAATR